MNILIREARDEDVPSIMEMDRDTIMMVSKLDGKKDLFKIAERHREHFMRFFNIATQTVFVAENKKEIIGFIWLLENAEVFTGTPYIFVMGIAVKPEWRKKGIGKHLMDRAEDSCRDRGFPYLKLMVNSKNKTALRLYRRLGFEVEELHMRKRLK